MAKVTVGKKKASAQAAAFAPPVVSATPPPAAGDDLEDLGDIDLDGGDLGEDILGDLDDLDLAEVDDLGVSVEEVEAAMASIAPAAPAAAVVGPSISDAAVAALSADVARLVKSAEALNPAPLVEAVAFNTGLTERLQAQVESLSQQVAVLHEFVVDSHKTLINMLAARPAAAPAPLVAASSIPVSVGPATDFSELDGFIRSQFEGLGAGKTYPAEKVAEVLCKRNTGAAVTVGTMLGRMQVVLADAFKKAGRAGFFSK